MACLLSKEMTTATEELEESGFDFVTIPEVLERTVDNVKSIADGSKAEGRARRGCVKDGVHRIDKCNGGETRSMNKITVELEFDDPAFFELYQEIAKRRGNSLGRTMARDLQNMLEVYRDNNTGEFGKWFNPRFEKVKHLAGLDETDFAFDPNPAK